MRLPTPSRRPQAHWFLFAVLLCRSVVTSIPSLQLKSKEEELINLSSVHTALTAQYDRRVAELELRVQRLTEANKCVGETKSRGEACVF